ncbi:MAG: uroporphyrinogen decarboxylase family protein [Spirochaetota bacterium]
MFNIPLKKPNPDFNSFVKILKGTKIPDKVEYAELLIDEEIRESILERFFNEKNYPPPIEQWSGMKIDEVDHKQKQKDYEKYYEQVIRFYYKMGYSVFADLTFITNFEALNTQIIKTRDTAALSKKDRGWAVEGVGLIQSWEDFEKFPWGKANGLIQEYEQNLKYLETTIPDGMKIGVVASLFEEVLEWILGYEGFFYMISDSPDLVEAIFNKVGELCYDFFNTVISSDVIGCIWFADDLGYSTATMISPKLLNKWVFPWFKKYASLAHQYEKQFFLHSCGNKDQIMDTLIEDVKIDAIHSFQDNGYPVTLYKKNWGNKVGIIGGVDIDKLARLNEVDLRKYVRNILDICMQNGRYIYGSGNSICNYIPVDNYLIMLDEGKKWNCEYGF